MGRHRLFTAKSAHEQQFSNTLGARIAIPFLGCFANSESPSYSQLNAQTRPGRSSNLGPTTNDVDGTGISQGKMIVSLVVCTNVLTRYYSAYCKLLALEPKPVIVILSTSVAVRIRRGPSIKIGPRGHIPVAIVDIAFRLSQRQLALNPPSPR